jgi:hypothetical protein
MSYKLIINMKNNTMIVTVLAVVVVGALAFFGGMKYQQMQPSQFAAGQFGVMGRGGNTGAGGARGAFGGARNGMRQTVGEILSADDQSITVKLPDGSTKIALLTKTTTVSKATEGSVADLKVGERVGVFGTENTDGSVTAQNIQLNPIVREFNKPSPSPVQ